MNAKDFEDYLKKKYPQTSSFFSGLALFFVDAIVLLLCISLGFFIVNIFARDSINFKSFINYSIFLPFVLLVFASMGLYPGIMIPPTEEVKKFCTSTFLCFTGIIFCILITDVENKRSIGRFFLKDSRSICICLAFFISFPIATILLSAMREFSKKFFSKFSWWGVPTVIYCADKSADLVIDRLLNNPYLGYHPAVIIDSNCKEDSFYKDIPIYSPDNIEIIDVIHKFNIKTAIICDYKKDLSPIMTKYRYTISVSKSQSSFTSTQQLKDIAGIIGFSSIHNLTFKANLFFKRILDLFLIIFFLPLLIPIFLILSILVKITSKGPIFYGHKRIGKNGKTIKCWKFRSMYIDSEEQLKKILAEDPIRREEWERDRKFVNDPRVTKFGKILRKTSLDELPQLINIFLGEMSFVGPRPVTESELSKYRVYRDYVLSVSPGLSGMWQISGRSDTGYEERISLDTFYIQNWSIWLDIWILIKTVWVVLVGRGAY